MSDYQYKNLPLTPSVAASGIVEHLSQISRPVKRMDIIRSVEGRHRDLGGLVRGDATSAFKRAFNRLVDDGVLKRNLEGYYSLATPRVADSDVDLTPEHNDSGRIDPTNNKDVTFFAEEEIGEGAEL